MAVSKKSSPDGETANVVGRVRRSQQAPVSIPEPSKAQLDYLEKVFRKRAAFDPDMVIGGPRGRARR